MAIVILFVVVGNVLLYSTLSVLAMRSGRQDASPRLRILSMGFSAACGAVVLGAFTRLALLAVQHGWLEGSPGDFLQSSWVLIQSLGVTAFGIGAVVILRKVGGPLRRAEQIVNALSDRVPSAAPISELGLTARELEVLEIIVAGTRSDKEIAEALYISPATAGTHVKNILRKAGVSSRRDLVLLAAGASGPSPTPSR